MIRSVVVKIPVEVGELIITRSFVNVSEKPRAFVSIQTALERENYRQNILRNALFELQTFQRKYSTYAELTEVFSAILVYIVYIVYIGQISQNNSSAGSKTIPSLPNIPLDVLCKLPTSFNLLNFRNCWHCRKLKLNSSSMT